VVEYLESTHNFRHLSISPFESIQDLCDYATSNWNENIVFIIDKYENVDALMKRPFFLMVAVDAPINSRYKRWKSRLDGVEALSLSSSLEYFIDTDGAMYANNVYNLMQQAVIRVDYSMFAYSMAATIYTHCTLNWHRCNY
jgi:hypothetical protein